MNRRFFFELAALSLISLTFIVGVACVLVADGEGNRTPAPPPVIGAPYVDEFGNHIRGPWHQPEAEPNL